MMNNTKETTEPAKTEDLIQKWEEPFRQLLDDIWWPGYSEQLLKEHPDKYQTEYFYFISLYD